ncbi:MAG: TraU family protein [Desulfobacteraceae bacterium]|jgi:hypothetical protein
MNTHSHTNLILCCCLAALLLMPVSLYGECCNEYMGVDEFNWAEMFSINRGSVCSCGSGIHRRFGTIIEFWEPVRIIDTTSVPYCAPARYADFDPLTDFEFREGFGDAAEDADMDLSHFGVTDTPTINPDLGGTRRDEVQAATNLNSVGRQNLAFDQINANAPTSGLPNAAGLGGILSGMGNPMQLSGLLDGGLGQSFAFIDPDPATTQPTSQSNTISNRISNLLGRGNINSNTPDKGKNDNTFLYAHIYLSPSIVAAVEMNDGRCVQSSLGNPIPYLSEVDAAWESPAIASFLEAGLVMPIFAAVMAGGTAMELIVADCFADAISSQMGMPNDLAYFFLGAWGFKYPLNGTVSNEDYSSANAVAAVRAAEVGTQTGRIMDTVTSSCHAIYNPLLLKRNFKLQQIRPVNRSHLISIGETSLLWGIADNPIVDRCKDNYSWILWRRRVCCGYL